MLLREPNSDVQKTRFSSGAKSCLSEGWIFLFGGLQEAVAGQHVAVVRPCFSWCRISIPVLSHRATFLSQGAKCLGTKQIMLCSSRTREGASGKKCDLQLCLLWRPPPPPPDDIGTCSARGTRRTLVLLSKEGFCSSKFPVEGAPSRMYPEESSNTAEAKRCARVSLIVPCSLARRGCSPALVRALLCDKNNGSLRTGAMRVKRYPKRVALLRRQENRATVLLKDGEEAATAVPKAPSRRTELQAPLALRSRHGETFRRGWDLRVGPNETLRGHQLPRRLRGP